MDFTRRQRKRNEYKPEVEDLEQLYPHNVMWYRIPPTQEITIQEFEDFAFERLKLLRAFERATSKNLRFLSDEWKESITAELNSEGLKGYLRLLGGAGGTKKELDLQARRRDYISHFILRIAYSQSEELKRWYVARELEIFKYKFSVLSSSEIKRFLELNNMHYTPLTETEKNDIKSGLMSSTIIMNNMNVDALDFYKVQFTKVLDLVRNRKCFLKSGFAYVSSNDFVSILAGEFESEVEKGLQAAQRILPTIEHDERVFHLLKGLHTSYTGKDYTISKNTKVPIESFDQLSKKSFPLCMRMCHETLRTNHHHKHGGRLQYGLFLKGIGVTLEDALRFWREEFTKTMDLDRFEKTYAYSIRHNYGKEGSRINYSPFSCMKIITANVGPQETHGCPFKLYDQSTLKTKLSSYGLSAAHVNEVISFAINSHYQLACTKYFEIIHDTTIDQGISHPNQYFELSQSIMNNRNAKSQPSLIGNSKVQPGTPTNKQKRPLGIKSDKQLLDDDDDELWNIAGEEENQITENINSTIGGTNNEENMWEDDFDVTQIENM